MRTWIGFAILVGAGALGYFVLPRFLGGGAAPAGSGSARLDQATGKVAEAADQAADQAAGEAAEQIEDALDRPWWAWTPPGYVLYEASEYLSGDGEE